MNAIAAAYLTAIAALCVICDTWLMRGAVHYDDTARGVMFHMAKLLINIFKEDGKN